MGTVLEITVAGPTEAEATAAIEELFRLATELERVFTVFEPESPVRRMNLRAGDGPQAVDAEMARILAESVAYWRLTGGTFDVTVGPLVDLWRLAALRNEPPRESELAASLALVGSDKILVGKGDSVALERPGMSVNLGGIAKGYALDRMEEQLRARGISKAFVSFGQSSILAVGAPADASGWRVLLNDAGEGFAGIATLRDQSLSVSSSFGQWSEIAGRRYGHVIDPRSGEALTRAAQAAVLAPSGALAEALSKALLILTPHEGLALLEVQREVEGLLIEADGSAHATSGWTRAVAGSAARERRGPARFRRLT
jgi:thiamine biosynthesis lipoprotein